MRYLGLDLGTKTLGVAISDKTNTLVTPLKVINFNSEDYCKALEEVKKITDDYHITKVILGLPKNMDGSMGFASERSLKFKEMLENINLEVILVDERLTTKSALDIVHLNNEDTKKSKHKIDAIAASIILENFLRKCENDSKE